MYEAIGLDVELGYTGRTLDSCQTLSHISFFLEQLFPDLSQWMDEPLGEARLEAATAQRSYEFICASTKSGATAFSTHSLCLCVYGNILVISL